MKSIKAIHRPSGLGSNFCAVIDWYWYSMHTGYPVYVDWSNLYGPPNIFNELFNQKHDSSVLIDPYIVDNHYWVTKGLRTPELDKIKCNEFPIFEKYDYNFYNRAAVYKEPSMNDIRLKFNQFCFNNISIKSEFLNFEIPPKTLGVHCRYIGHFGYDFSFKTMVKDSINKEQFYKKNIDDIKKTFEEGNFENIYVACHALPYFNILQNEFKDKLLYLDYNRWGNEYYDTNDYSLNEYAIALSDIVNLSKCSQFICSISNFSFMVLIFNPELKFKLFSIMENWCGG